METVSDPTPTQLAFAEAVREFKSKLKNDQLYVEILKTTSIEEVYDATDALQAEQGKLGRIRHLSKIKPYLEGLRGYADIIDTFVQVKPDVLALIWGPIKLLIQWTTSLTQSIDALVNTAAEIGELLPEFKLMAAMFGQNEQLKLVLVLFFQDILDFYTVTLKFFSLPHWRFMFEALWPLQKDKIKIVLDHIKRHTDLMRNKVRSEHIREEYEHRKRAFEHFEETQKSNRRQEYSIIKTDLSPMSYDNELYRLRGQVCKGTGDWLRQASDFTKWLDADDDSTRILWLCGIPGAGKTHLASMAIDFTASTRTIFAFLNHANSSNTSALSVVHSLIFQLASGDENLQEVLCGSSRENLKNNLGIAVGLLQTLLHSAGPVSITIDGVDEIDISERGRLLHGLHDISKACEKTILLISSRAEDDILTILGPISSTIRVDSHNAESIQIFINDWAQKWFLARDFLPEDKSEIEGLLAPLSIKAKGMFLYVKIMLSSIEELDNLDEIRSELRVLPENLDEAYGRVFEKIDRKSQIVKKKCRLILGWISCSPTPLTLLELEQALVVAISGTSRVSSRLNIVRLCGPIIEVVADNVRFVHFTVKEYIHSRHKIENYIDHAEATLSLAICCMQYLCQDHHSPNISEKDLQDNIRTGNYRLHYYSTDTWLDLVAQYLRLNKSEVLSKELLTTLEEFHKERGSQNFCGSTELDGQRYPLELHQIESCDPNLFCFLRNVAQFRQKCSTSLYNLGQVDGWNTLNPIVTSTITKTLYVQFDTLACQAGTHVDECLCPILHRHYGQRLYKCGFFSCPFHRQGFPTCSLRDSHQKSHDLPWKCDVPSCHYSEAGFLSKAMRDKHLDLHREEARDDRPGEETLLLSPKSDDIQPFLFDLVYADDVESAENLLPLFGKIRGQQVEELLKLVGHSGSVAMKKLIIEKCFPRFRGFTASDLSLKTFVLACIDGQSSELLTWLLLGDGAGVAEEHYFKFIRRDDVLARAIATGSMEIIQVVDRYFATCYMDESRRMAGTLSDRYISKAIINATAKCPDREDYVIKAYYTHRLHRSGSLDNALRNIARTTFSIRFAQVLLLQHGVHVDARNNSRGLTPLHWAARHDCDEAAHFIKFLLYQGADPENDTPKGERIWRIRDEKGAKNISKWLGMSWDELIRKVKEDREKGIQWP